MRSAESLDAGSAVSLDILPFLKEGDSYGSQAHCCAGAASVGSCFLETPDRAFSPQANKARPAS